MVHLTNNLASDVKNAYSNSMIAFLQEFHAFCMHERIILPYKFSPWPVVWNVWAIIGIKRLHNGVAVQYYGGGVFKLRWLSLLIEQTHHCGAVHNYDGPDISDHSEETAPRIRD